MFKIQTHWQIIIAIILAVVVGLSCSPETQLFGAPIISYFDFLGKVFLNALKMLIVPLIFSSIASGVASLGGVKGFGRLGMKTGIYYVATSIVAILIGLIAVNTIKPGFVNGIPGQEIFPISPNTAAKLTQIGDRGLGDLVQIFIRMVPPNILDAATSNGNMLGIIFFSLVFGFFITKMQNRELQKHMENSVQGLSDVMMLITQWVMKFAPYGVFGLVAKTVTSTGMESFSSLAKFFVTVMIALSVHFLIVMPLILKFVAGVNPWRHYAAMKEALLCAFSTSSSSATLPITMKCVEAAGVSKKTSSFVLPLGATINMDGTALFECVAAMFIAQAYGVDMSFITQFLVVSLALLTSIGVAGIPSASLVAIVVILNNIGVPEEGIGILFAVDRILDMCRTSVNVFSDSCGAIVIAKSEGETGILTS